MDINVKILPCNDGNTTSLVGGVLMLRNQVEPAMANYPSMKPSGDCGEREYAGKECISLTMKCNCQYLPTLVVLMKYDQGGHFESQFGFARSILWKISFPYSHWTPSGDVWVLRTSVRKEHDCLDDHHGHGKSRR